METTNNSIITGTAYKGTVYMPFSMSVPSENCLGAEESNAMTTGGPRRTPVSFATEGWVEGAEAQKSTLSSTVLTTPAGEPFVLLFFAVWYSVRLFLRLHRKRFAVLMAAAWLCILPMFSSNTISLTLSASDARIGDSITVTPAFSGTPPEGYLCWKLYHDAACTNEVADVPFSTARTGNGNQVYFHAPETGTYYIKAVRKTSRRCNNPDYYESAITSLSIYPEDADIVLVRRQQERAMRMNLRAVLPENKKLYGVMQFERNTVNNPSLSTYRRYNYFFSLPFDVRVGDITGFGTYGTDWLIDYYDGLSRAQNGSWTDSESYWKHIDDTDSVLHAGQGYLLKLNTYSMTEGNTEVWKNGADIASLYFPALNPVSDISTRNETIPALSDAYRCTIDHSATYGSEADRRVKDSYWRCIGVPGMTDTDDAPFEWGTDDLPYLYEWDMTDNSLHVISSASHTFRTMHAYLVQNGNSIIWRNTDIPAAIPALKRQAQESELRLVLSHNGAEADHTFIRLTDREEVTEAFDFGFDLSKELNAGANLYTLIGSERVAANGIPRNGTAISIPVGVQVSQTGEYTFSIPDGTHGELITLVDSETGTRTTLGLTGYTVRLDAGTYDKRFVLEIGAGSTTGMTETEGEKAQDATACKVIENGALYIIRGEKRYNAQGIRLR